jgi:hypothetical protein
LYFSKNDFPLPLEEENACAVLFLKWCFAFENIRAIVRTTTVENWLLLFYQR